MYQYQNAFIKEEGRRGRWLERDVSSKTISSLFSDFQEVVLVLTHPVLSGEVALKISDLPGGSDARTSMTDVSQWLLDLGNQALPTTDEIPDLGILYAPYRDAWQAGYDIEAVSQTTHLDVGLPKSERPHLRLTKAGVDYEDFYRECLVSVNGIIHRTSHGTNGILVEDGAKSGFHANQNHVGIYRLGLLGDMEIVDIQDHHIHPMSDQQRLCERTVVELDDSVDLEGKSVLLVIQGYLHTLGDLVQSFGERTFQIDFNNYPLAQRFYHFRQLVDTEDFESHLTKSTVNPNQVALEELYSDETIRKLLTLSQTFFVVLDTPELVVDRDQVEFSGLPGRYICHQVPSYPLVTGLGGFEEYWMRQENDQYVIGVENGLETYYTFETAEWENFHSIDNTRVPCELFDYSRAYLLKIGRSL